MFSPRPIFLLFILSVLTAAGTVHGQTAWYEGFEGAEISWRDAGGDAQYRILDHRRVQNEAHTGKGCEWLRVSANGGSYVYIAHDVGRPIVIDELMPSLWIKSDRSGLQLLARLVLPRTIDSKTGRPVSTLVAGTSYTDAGRWQELRITDMPRLLARQIRSLHGQLGPNVDGREAYIDAVILNVYGGPRRDERMDRRFGRRRVRQHVGPGTSPDGQSFAPRRAMPLRATAPGCPKQAEPRPLPLAPSLEIPQATLPCPPPASGQGFRRQRSFSHRAVCSHPTQTA